MSLAGPLASCTRYLRRQRRSARAVRIADLRRLGAACLASLVTGCATTGTTRGDPLEGFNRGVFAFNEALDTVLLKPLATGYEALLPEIVRTGVDNFFDNLVDAWSAVNHLLQGKPVEATEMGVRFGMNTFIGLGGLIDVASDAGLERRSEDFGQTLGRWGFGPGPYIMLPLLGPSTLRDTSALVLDWRATPVAMLHESRDRVPLAVLQVISTRARLLSVTRAIDEIAIDKYALIRDGFLARRRNQVYDGDPPDEPPPPEAEDEPPPK
jgi:phospholipid-binding lipoprotein MlaA